MSDKLVGRWILILCVFALAAWVLYRNPLNYGIDLRGGVSLSYQVDLDDVDSRLETPEARAAALDETIGVISTRINSLGVKDISVRREGENRIKIQAPQMTKAELDSTKRTMTQLGDLVFPIAISASKVSNASVITSRNFDRITKVGGTPTMTPFRFVETTAEEQRKAAIADAEKYRNANGIIPLEVTDANGKTIRPYRNGAKFWFEDAQGRLPIAWVPDAAREPSPDAKPEENDRRRAYSEALKNARAGRPHDASLITGSWIYFDPEFFGDTEELGGRDITDVREGRDNQGFRTVTYRIITARQDTFADYTKDYLGLPMALVLNDELWTAPTLEGQLSDNVQITGGIGGFSAEEVRFIINCLQSGSLRLRPTLESEEEIEATLGGAAIQRGISASIIGGAIIILFMLFFYKLSGLIAVFALTANLGLLLALLAFFGATITLPGIAGIVLTIGMAIDASILIFERIREEIEKSKTLAAAIKAGFDRAFVTILDANITTIITGILLYQYGVGPIRGFAVTLIAGIVCSLFTALFFSRACFLFLLKGSNRTTLSMRRLVKDHLKIDFIKHGKRALTISSLLVVGSLGLFVLTEDQKKYGLDFTGGTIVRINLDQDLSAEDIKSQIDGLRDDQNRRMILESEVTRVQPVTLGEYTPKAAFEVKLQMASRISATDVVKVLDPDLRAIFPGRNLTRSEPMNTVAGGSWSIEFELPEAEVVSEVRTMIGAFRPTDAVRASLVPYENARIEPIGGQTPDNTKAKRFLLSVTEQDLGVADQLTISLAKAFAANLPKSEAQVDFARAFPKSNYIGPNVVADLKERAMVAVLFSLIALVLYLWMRFRSPKYGIAAAVAVFHDVIVALGAVVLVNATGLVHVPISLATIAGFLTIIGYSLNDTIVIFDRVRENLGNIRGSYREVVNHSINQTLTRTLLTSLTTLLVVVVLFALNIGQESPIEGIAFTLMIGVLVGTYSTIFVACPIAIWLTQREERKATGTT